MIDEGLWLVCYEHPGVPKFTKGSTYMQVHKKCDSYELQTGLDNAIGKKNYVITNMVRLGDIEQEVKGDVIEPQKLYRGVDYDIGYSPRKKIGELEKDV